MPFIYRLNYFEKYHKNLLIKKLAYYSIFKAEGI